MNIVQAKNIIKDWETTSIIGRVKTKEVFHAELIVNNDKVDHKRSQTDEYTTTLRKHLRAIRSAKGASKTNKKTWESFKHKKNEAIRQISNTSSDNNRIITLSSKRSSNHKQFHPFENKVEIIIHVIRAEYLLTHSQIKYKSTREPYIVEARQLVMYFSFHVFKIASSKQLANYLGKIDHSTVLHGRTAIMEKMDSYEYFNDKVIKIQTKIEQLITLEDFNFNNFSL